MQMRIKYDMRQFVSPASRFHFRSLSSTLCAACMIALACVMPSNTQAQPRPDRPMASQPQDSAIAIDAGRIHKHVLPAPWRETGFRIQVWTPLQPAPAGGYPVVYMLDGNAAFDSLVQERRQRKTAQAVPAILVGVGYDVNARYDVTARSLDYTPPSPGAERPLGTPADPSAPAGRSLPGGGADRLLDWMQTTLKPFIAGRYAIDPTRQTLFGHSYGGLFVLHALLSRPELYQDYVAASPSLWWNNRAILTEARSFVSRPALSSPARLHVITGSKEVVRTAQADHPATLVKSLQEVNGLAASYEEAAGAGHGDTFPIGLVLAIRGAAAR